jgi:hypothetical protein
MNVATLFLSLLLIAFGAAHPVAACPNCKDAVAVSSEDGAIDAAYSGNAAAAYNNSVLMMLFAPYVLVLGLAALAWRSCRRAARSAAAAEAPPVISPGEPRAV